MKCLAIALLFCVPALAVTRTYYGTGNVQVVWGTEVGGDAQFVIIAVTPDMPYVQPEPKDAHESMLCMAEIEDFDQVPCHVAIPLPVPKELR